MNDLEIIDEETGEIVPVEEKPGAIMRGPVMTPTEARQQAEAIREMQQAVLREGIDYGQIPGTPKPSLLKPGAEWLLKWFGLNHHFEMVERDQNDQGINWSVTYRCIVTDPEGRVAATCDGHASRDERKWENLTKTPWNTLVKMAQKRALVGAALQATGTSGVFTQDVEDYQASQPQGPSLGESFSAIVLAFLGDAEKEILRQWWHEQQLPKPEDLTAAQAINAAFTAGQIHAGTVPEAPPMTEAQHRRLMQLLREHQMDDDDRHTEVLRRTNGRTNSSTELTRHEASEWIEELTA